MPKARKATTLTRDEVKAEAEALMDAFVAGSPQRTLEFAARLAAERAHAHRLTGAFKVWSVNNRLYLEAQARRRKEALKFLFAGKAQWEALGRKVRSKTETVTVPAGCPVPDCVGGSACPHAEMVALLPPETMEVEVPVVASYKIFGSPVYRVKGDEDPNGNRTEEIRHRRAPLIEVYDWTQTTAVDPDYVEPDWETPLAIGDLDTLRQMVAACPVPVVFEDLAARNYHGAYDGTTITIDASAAVGNQIVELARQWGHHQLGHASFAATPRRIRNAAEEAAFTARYVAEQESGLVGWLVAKSLGLDEQVGNQVTEQAAEYLHRWSKFNQDGEPVTLEGTKARRRLVVSRLDTALRATDAIVSAYCAAAAVEEAAENVAVAV